VSAWNLEAWKEKWEGEGEYLGKGVVLVCGGGQVLYIDEWRRQIEAPELGSSHKQQHTASSSVATSSFILLGGGASC